MNESSTSTPTQLTDLIQAWSDGQAGASTALAEQVYGDLQRIALAQIQREPHMDMEPAELVHEAWLRLSHVNGAFPSRQHFFAFAALQMRRLLIDCARANASAARRGEKVTLSLRLVDPGPQPADMAAFADALEQLEHLDPRKSQAFALTEMGGFDHRQVAEMLDISLATVERDLRFARVWLAARIT